MQPAIRYSLLRGLFSVLLMSAWLGLVLSLGVTGFFANMLLVYASLQLFESVGRKGTAPSFPTFNVFAREGVAMGVSVALALIDSMESNESDIVAAGTSLMLLLFSGFAHLLGTRRKPQSVPGHRPLRLHLLSVLAFLALAWALSLGIDWPVDHPVDAMAMTGLIFYGATLTTPRARAVFWAYRRFADEGDDSLASRVEAARRGHGSSVLLRLNAHGVMDEFVRFEDIDVGQPAVVRVPESVLPELAVGEWVLAEEPVIVESVGGGDGYRAGDEYQRLDRCTRFDVLKTLPATPKSPLHPMFVEVGLVALVALITGIGLMVGKYMST